LESRETRSARDDWPVVSLAWSDDEAYLAAGGQGSIRVYETDGLSITATLEGHNGQVHAMAWLAEHSLGSIDDHGQYRVWDTRSGRSRTLFDFGQRVYDLPTFSPDRRTILMALDDTVRAYTTDAGKPRGVFVSLPNDRYLSVAPEGHYCGSAGIENEIVYVARTAEGIETFSTETFAREYGWKNDPSKVSLLRREGSDKTRRAESFDAPSNTVSGGDARLEERAHRMDATAWSKKLGIPLEISNGIGMKLRLVPPGEFKMGTPENQIERLTHFPSDVDQWKSRLSSESPAHQVRISQPLYFGIYEVTQDEFQTIMGKNPSAFSKQGVRGELIRGQGTELLPVEDVTYTDAVRFCNQLSRRENLRPNYHVNQQGVVTYLTGNGYRLPTEAEWEYACRAGSVDLFFFGDNDSELSDFGWYVSNSDGRPHPVGQKRPNAFGLFDMYGNVWEWCQDWWGPYDADSIADDPQGPEGGSARVGRGGDYYSDSAGCRSGSRGFLNPENRHTHPGVPGFRVVKVIELSEAKP
jgi:formylglycine-generating enzyme required for sulfatase activity